jgi:hypothetical protein
MLNLIQATKATKVSNKVSTPSVPYVEVKKDGASDTAIQWFLKGGARGLIQGNKTDKGQSQFVTFAFCSDTKTLAFRILKNKAEYDKMDKEKKEVRELKAGVNLSGGYGCSCLKKSIKLPDGLDFTDMESTYQGKLEKIENPKDNLGFQYKAVLTLVAE